MTKELVISTNRHETKVALIEDDQLVEIFFQRSNEYSLVGSIHKGRVTRVLPGMQSAFVELGLERDAFLYVSDFLEQTGEDYERIGPAGDEPKGEAAPVRAERPERGERGDRGGRRDRGDRRGDRGGDRPAAGGERTGEPRPPVIATPRVVEAAIVPVEMEAPADGEPVEGVETVAATGEPGQDLDRNGDRRGGRGRRRRRRGGRPGGMPDSKFASASDTETDTEEGEDGEPTVAGDSAPVVESSPAAAAIERFVLPGESIAKYTLPGESIAKYRREEAVPDEEPEPEPAAVEAAIVAVDEPEPEEEEAEVRELIAEHIESHQAAVEQAEAAADAAQEQAEQSIAAESGEPEDEQPDAVEASGEGDAGEPEPVSGEAVVREDQPTARYIQRRERNRSRRGGRNGGGGGGGGNGGGGGGGRSSGGGERYDAVPRTAPPAEALPFEAVAGEAKEDATAAGPAPAVRPERAERRDRGDRGERPPMPSISDLLKEGQEIIVQIYKEPLGTKGARITSHVAMPGRYVVFMPTADHHGVSRKLGDDAERLRLKRIVQTHSQGMVGGFIVRTAGEGKPEADIAADMSSLYNQWLDIRKKAEKRRAPCLLHSDLELVMRTLRDQVNDQYKAIWVDHEELYETIVGFLERFQPALVSRVKMYSREAPIFDTFNITSELEKALRPKVWLKSGGYIVINQTEALVAIDINTGKFVGKSNRLEDTIVKTNVEAVKEIVRQIRLRDLGGIIVVDFIDMEERKNRQKVMQALEEAMGMDRAPYKILQFNDFGLVAITRRRVKQSLERALCSPCPTCEGAGYVKSVGTVMSEILTEAHKIRPGLEGKDVMLRVNPEVGKSIKSDAANYMQELEEILGRVVIVKSDPLLHPEKFDLA